MGGSFVLKQLMREALQVVFEAEMSEALGAGLGERREGRRGYRAGYYSWGLVTPYQGCLSCGCRETAMGGFRRSCSPGPQPGPVISFGFPASPPMPLDMEGDTLRSIAYPSS